jgi:antitoxin FitA
MKSLPVQSLVWINVQAVILTLRTNRKVRYHDINIGQHSERPMAQFVVRHLEDDVKTRLKRRAAHHGRSMEEEVRHILRDAVKDENQPVTALGSRIAARFAKSGLTTDLPELRGRAPRPAEYGT